MQSGEPTLVFPQIADGGGIRSEIILTNPGSFQDTGTISLKTPDGQQLTLEVDGVELSSIPYSIKPGGILRLETDGGGDVKVGYAVIESSLGDSELTGSIIYNLNGFEVSVPDSSPGKQHQVFVERNDQANSGIALVNLNNNTIAIQAVLLDDKGVAIAETTINLDAANQIAKFIPELFPDAPAQVTGSIRASSDDDFALVGLRQKFSGSLATLGGALSAGSSTSLIFAQIADGGGIRSEIILTNSGDQQENGTIFFKDSNGQPLSLAIDEASQTSIAFSIPPRGALKIETDGTGDVKVGYATVELQNSESKITGSIVYNLNGFEVSVPDSPVSDEYHVFAERTASANSGVAFANPMNRDITIGVFLLGANGDRVAEGSVDLPAGRQVAKSITEIFADVDSNFVGSFQARSEGEFTMVGLRQRANGSLSTLSGSPTTGIQPQVMFSLFDLFPDSPVESINPDAWQLSKEDTFVRGTDYWGEGLDEQEVFYTRLKHIGDTDWELRIGKGSQVYSARIPIGELVPPQRYKEAHWVDGVWQTVAVNREKNDDQNNNAQPPDGKYSEYFIHQAGIYPKYHHLPVDLNWPAEETFYSPIIDESWSQEKNAYASLVWPLQAHNPSIHKSNILTAQQTRDIGEGIIEFTIVVYNYGPDLINFVNTPYFPIRKSTVPIQLISTPDGEYKLEHHFWVKGNRAISIDDTAGWFIFAKEDNPLSQGVGIVFGKDKHYGESFQYSRSKFRWGEVEIESRDQIVSTVLRRVNIPQHTAFYYRYYIILNKNVEDIARTANEIVDYVDYGPIEYNEETTGIIPICTRITGGGQQVYKRGCAEGETPVFYTYRLPVKEARPLFHLRNMETKQIILTTNPYEISSRPYDGSTRYLKFLGFGILPASSNNECFDYSKIVDITDDSSYYPRNTNVQKVLEVRTSSENICVECTQNSQCNDGLFCNGAETCQAGVCQAGTAIDCSALNDQCNVGVCDEASDSCVKQAANEGLICNDGLFCNVGETCQSGSCIGGSANSCSDGNSCTTDSCNEVVDSCINTAVTDGTLCNDSQFCTVNDACTAGVCGGASRDCSDPVSCTIDSCNEATDSCVNSPDNSLCSDGLFCNGVEICDATLDCQAGTPPIVNDNVTCTTDSCDEINDTIVNTPDDSLCDNGLFCDGSETCDALLDCQVGTPPSANDSVGCTVDSCDEINDTIVNTPDDSLCDNGLFCDGSETCDALLDCQSGTPVVCDDGNTCTTDSCDEANDACENIPIPECSASVKCWNAEFGFLKRSKSQVRKFCKCAAGIYGFEDYNRVRSRENAYAYVDPDNNENWGTTLFSNNRRPIYKVECTEDAFYFTNQDHLLPMRTTLVP